MINPPKVYVLILTYNGKQLLYDSITSYLANDYSNFRVIVIDNGSTDGSDEYVREAFPDAVLLRSETNLFYSGGFNLGLKYAFVENDADYVLITNNDVKADSGIIKALVESALEDPKRGFVMGKVYYFDNPDILQTVGKKQDDVMWNGGHIGQGEKDNGQYDVAEERAWCDDIYWLVSRQVFEQTGGYDTEFSFQAEDFDWEARAKLKGFVIYYTPKAKLWHKESVTLGKTSPRKAYYDARNPIIVHLRYRNSSQFKVFFWKRTTALIRSICHQMLHLRFCHVWANVRGLGSAVIWGISNKKLTFKHIF